MLAERLQLGVAPRTSKEGLRRSRLLGRRASIPRSSLNAGPVTTEVAEQAVGAVRSKLDEAGSARAWGEGLLMTLDKAVAAALALKS